MVEEMQTNLQPSGEKGLKCDKIDQFHFKNDTMCGGLDFELFRER